MPETIRILCVDDETNILNVIKRQLCDEDLEIYCAQTVEEGLELLHRHPPIHVVLSDYRMPGMNGIEFLKKVQQVRPEAVGIILSGFADIPLVKKSLESNHLFRYLRKPWRADDLRQAIAEAALAATTACNPKLSLTGD